MKIHLLKTHSLDKLHQEEEEMDLQMVMILMIMNLTGILKEVDKDLLEEDHLMDPLEEICMMIHTMLNQLLMLMLQELLNLSDQLQFISTLSLRMIVFLSGMELHKT